MNKKTSKKSSFLAPGEPPQKAVTVRISEGHYRALVRIQRRNKEAYVSTFAAHLLERTIDELEGTPTFSSALDRIEEAQKQLHQETAQFKSIRKLMKQTQFELLIAIYLAELSQTLPRKEAKEKAIVQAKSMIQKLNPPSPEQPTKTPSVRRQ